MEQHRRSKAGMGQIAAAILAETELHHRAKLDDRVIVMEQALVKYGDHTAVCRFRSNRHLPPMKCICGFKELMKSLGI